MYIKGGLRFQRTENDGLHITVQDGVAENAPVLREVILDPVEYADLREEIAPTKKAATKKAKTAKKAPK